MRDAHDGLEGVRGTGRTIGHRFADGGEGIAVGDVDRRAGITGVEGVDTG